jgi:GNAT superfamily N-acetyltransferase
MISVRLARPADAAGIAESQVLMARETEGLELDAPTVARGVQAVFADPAKGTYYVAEEGAKVIGCLLVTPEWSDWRSATIWWIQSVYVAADARGRGAYRALYEHVKAEVTRRPDLCGLRLYVDLRNARARRVYEALGMTGEHYQVYEWMKG